MVMGERSIRSKKCLKYCSIVGAHFIMAPLSYLWIYGNLSAYMDSYFRFGCSTDCIDGDSQWISSLFITMVCPGIFITKKLADKIGFKWFGILFTFLLGASIFGGAWVIDLSVSGSAVLLGVNIGLAQGVCTVTAFQYVSGWAPERAPLFMASTSAASTLMSLIQNQIITAIVNPNNLKPDAMIGSRTFFSQREVLDRVPTAIIAYAAMTMGLQLIGYLLLAPRQEPDTLTPSIHTNTTTTDKERGSLTEQPDFGNGISSRKLLNSYKAEKNGMALEAYGSNDVTISNGNPANESAISVKEENNSKPLQEQQISMNPKEVLKTRVFYSIFMFGAATMFSLLLKSNYYKQFGLIYIHNDRYLTLVGTLIPIIASVSRVIIGLLLSRNIVNIKDTVVFSLSVNTILCSFWYIVPQVNEVLYMFFILCLAVVQSLSYVILPVAALQIFGPAHFSTNYGLLQLCFFFVGILSPFVISPIITHLGWLWLFDAASILCLLALMLVVSARFKLLNDNAHQ